MNTQDGNTSLEKLLDDPKGPSKPEHHVILIGKQGAGRKTLYNSLANYLRGNEY